MAIFLHNGTTWEEYAPSFLDDVTWEEVVEVYFNNGGIWELVYAKEVAPMTFTATDDVVIRAGTYADTNFASETDLQIKNDPGTTNNTRNVLLRFDVSAFSGEVDTATLRLYLNWTLAPDQPLTIHVADSVDWDEDTVTWNTAPENGTLVGVINLGAAEQWYEIDIRDAVVAALAGDGIVSLRLSRATTSTDAFGLASKEEYPEYAAQIVVTAPKPPPPGAVFLGDKGYADWFINGSIFAQPQATCEIAGTLYQAVVFWNVDGNGDLFIRNDQGTGDWTEFTEYILPYGPPADDDHNTINVAFDEAGYIHIAYNHHNDPLHYRISLSPVHNGFDGSFSAERPMVGLNESAVSYPCFINDHLGRLYFMFRDALVPGARKLIFYTYDQATDTWANAAGTADGVVLDGDIDNAWPYWDFVPTFDENHHLHITWVWRVNDDLAQTQNYHYMKWDRTGFVDENGNAQTIPATRANCNVVWEIPPYTGLLNQNGVTVNPVTGHPHVAYMAYGSDLSTYQIFHLWYDGLTWQRSQVTNVVKGPNPPGGYLSRPSIAVDTNGRAHVVVRNFYDPVYSNQVMVYSSDDYTNWLASNVFPLNVGSQEPTYDHTYWRKTGKFQFCLIPFFDDTNPPGYPVYVVQYAPPTGDAINYPPQFTTTAPTTAEVDSIYTYNVAATDLEGAPITLAATVLPSWLSFTDNGNGTGTLTGTPIEADVGDHPVTLTATADGATVSQSWTITVLGAGSLIVAPCTGDVSIRGGNFKNTRYGGEYTTVMNGGSGNTTYIAYYKFDVSAATLPVSEAKLRLYCVGGFEGGTNTVCRISDDAWDESTLTYNLAPITTIGDAIGVIPVLMDNVAELDVTEDVNALGGDGTLSVAIFSSAVGSTGYWATKENIDPLKRPSIIIKP